MALRVCEAVERVEVSFLQCQHSSLPAARILKMTAYSDMMKIILFSSRKIQSEKCENVTFPSITLIKYHRVKVS